MNYRINRKSFFVLMLATLLLLVFFLKDDFGNILQVVMGANPFWLLMSLLAIGSYWLLDAKIFQMILQTYSRRIPFPQIFKLTLATQFFNGITPFATGGQPFQIYVLHKESKLSYSSLTSAAFQNFIVYQVALVFYCLIAVLLHLFTPYFPFGNSPAIKTLIIIGFTMNFLIIALLVAISESKRMNRYISIGLLHFLHRIHLIKDEEKARKKLLSFINDFHDNMVLLKNHGHLFLSTIGMNLLKLTCFYVVAYFICRSLGIRQISLLEAILASSYTMLITSLVPVPGASGGAEFGFLAFFGSLIFGHIATAIMLLWRLITYYVGLIVGFLVFTFSYKPSA